MIERSQVNFPELNAALDAVIYQFARGVDKIGLPDKPYSALVEHVKGLTDWDFKRILGVTVPPGQRIQMHSHPEIVFIYQPRDHPTRLIVEEQTYGTYEGTLVKIPPGIKHGIEKNTTDYPRLTIALMFEEPSAASRPPAGR